MPVISASAFTHTVTERFLRYVVIDTQSDAVVPDLPFHRKAESTSAGCSPVS